jgi:hypothetical protein
MSEEARKLFLEQAARDRTKPTFELQERRYRLNAAKMIRRTLEAVRDGLALTPAVYAIFESNVGRPYDLTPPAHNSWLKAWAASDEVSLREALVGFLDPDLEAEQRFARFAEAAERAQGAGKIEATPEALVAFGSLFNFAVEPQSMPVILPDVFARLQQATDSEQRSTVSAAESYKHHLAAARGLQAEMQSAGISIRDMLDVQSLIALASQNGPLLSAGPQRDPRRDAASSQPPLTDSEKWERFLRYAGRARAKPTFDREERNYRLEVAERLGGMLEAVNDALELPVLVGTVFAGVYSGQPYSLTVQAENAWLGGWAHADEQSLRRALAGFLDADRDAVSRFAHFSQNAAEAEAKGLIAADARAVLLFGSLFNFTVDPGTLPIVRVEFFAQLEQILGNGPELTAPVVEQYERHLAFSRQLQTRMEREGIPVRDMVDVQSLISLTAFEKEFWASDPPSDQPESPRVSPRRVSDGADRGRAYLSVCAIYRDEAPYLREWIEFHRLVGVERFFLYDNASEDTHLDALAPYLGDGVVVLHDWRVFPGQMPALVHCLDNYCEDSRWIAFIDIDEFLFSPTGHKVSEILVDYEEYPGVGVNRATFGTSGHRTTPPGLVIESYLDSLDTDLNRYINTIADPRQVARASGPHAFSYKYGSTVDELGYPVHGVARTKSVSMSRLRINHYQTKSEEEFRRKCRRPRAKEGRFEPWPNFEAMRREERAIGSRDEAILKYLPSLREALARAEAPGAAVTRGA